MKGEMIDSKTKRFIQPEINMWKSGQYDMKVGQGFDDYPDPNEMRQLQLLVHKRIKMRDLDEQIRQLIKIPANIVNRPCRTCQGKTQIVKVGFRVSGVPSNINLDMQYGCLKCLTFVSYSHHNFKIIEVK